MTHLLRRQPIQITNDSVVSKDVEFTSWKENGEKPVVFFFAGVVLIPGLPFSTSPPCTGGAVMPVRDIEDGRGRKEFGKFL